MPIRVITRAFTLAEIAISLALVALSVTSVLLLFPTGIRAQQHARFQLYAAAKAQEMVEAFSSATNANAVIDTEATQPWDVPVAYRSTSPDLETRISSHLFGIVPLPPAIARRIDSDGDEIARILDGGGDLYYSAPQATTGLDPMAVGVKPPNEAQRLVFAVTGYAQNNSLYAFPWKAWPYYAPYPSPPLHGLHIHDANLPATAQTYVFPRPAPDPDLQSYCWESCDPNDPDADAIGVVFDHVEGGVAYGFRQYAYDPALDQGDANRCAAANDVATKRAAVVRYLQTALWFAQHVGMPAAVWTDPLDAAVLPMTGFLGGDASPSPPAAKQVLAMRFLAHAALCLTRWYTTAELGRPGDTATAVSIPSVTLDGVASPPTRMTHDRIIAWYESCMTLAMRFAASFPYDWGAPRPTNRATMMDFPLIEWDIADSTNLLPTAPITGTALAAVQWRPLAVQPVSKGGIADYSGVSYQFPAAPFDGPGTPPVWSPHPERVTITLPFDACERCRQLVFWAVDWQAYEDFETAPSAPLDASKYPFAAPLQDPGGAVHGFDQRMDDLHWVEDSAMYRNAEKILVFTQPVAAMATGSSVAAICENRGSTVNDQGVGSMHVFCGVFGADRNCNGVLDRGPVPPSTRMRAVRIARFNFYDPRVPLLVR